jgi:hypothetical protein
LVKTKDTLVSVICPIFNEVQNDVSFFKKLTDLISSKYEQYEVILVCDSRYESNIEFSRQIVANFEGTRSLHLLSNVGTDILITAALESCIGDYVVVLVPQQDPVDLTLEFLDKCISSQAIVLGTRSSPHENILTKLLRNGFYFLANTILGLNLMKNTTFFVAMNRKAVTEVTRTRDRFRFLKTITAQIGFPTINFPYEGEDQIIKRSLIESINLSINVLVSQTTRILRFSSLLLFLILSINTMFLFIYFFKNEYFRTLILLSFNAALFALLVISEYLIYLINESKSHPLYYMNSEISSKNVIANKDLINVVAGAKDIV